MQMTNEVQVKLLEIMNSLIEYLQKNCPFKIIDSEQCCNVYREYITNITKNHLYQMSKYFMFNNT